MGAGKTAVGRVVAKRLGWEMVDNDVRFEAATGTTARAYAAEHGVEAMHAEERRLLEAALRDADGAVVTAPGSIALMDHLDLSSACVVWLRVPVDELAARVAAGSGHRPLLDGDAREALAGMATRRGDRLEALADVVVDGDRPVPEVADAVIGALATCRDDA
jgi:shikimate kinase